MNPFQIVSKIIVLRKRDFSVNIKSKNKLVLKNRHV